MDVSPSQPQTTAGELAELAPQLAKLLADSIQADRCAVFVYSADQHSTIALFRHGYPTSDDQAHRWTDQFDPARIPTEDWVIKHKRPLQRLSPSDFERFPLVNPGQEGREGRLADVTIPLIWEDEVQGSACIWRAHDPEPFSDADLERLMELGRVVAMTVVFARGYDDERIQRQRMDALLEVATASSSGEGMDDVFQVLVKSVRRATESDICALYLYNDDGGGVFYACQDGMLDEEVVEFDEAQSLTVFDVPAELRLKRTKEPLVVRDYRNQLAADTPLTKRMIRDGIPEVLVLPVVWQGESLGVIYCWDRSRNRQFTQSTIEIAEAIAQQAGGVITRARLEIMLQRQVEESEAILRIGQSVLQSETLGPVLDEISLALHQLIPFSYAFVSMLTRDGQHLRVVREWGDEFRPIRGELLPVEHSISGTAVRERRTVTTQNVMDDSRSWKRMPPGKPLNAMMVVPLSYDNNIFGTLMLARAENRRFTPREEQLLTLLSQPASMAIERVQSREELGRRAERQAFLAKVGDLLVSSSDTERVLQSITDLAAGTLGQGAVIGLAGWEFGAVRWVADSFDDAELAERLHSGLVNFDLGSLRNEMENVLVSNQEIVFRRSELPAHQDLLRIFLEDLGVHHLLVLPLFQRSRAPGMLILMSRREASAFQEDEIQLARIVAQRIGDALERQQIKRNHEALLRVSEALHAQPDVSELMNTIAVELDRILPCDQMIIADVDQTRNMLHTAVYWQGGRQEDGREFFEIEEGICGEAVNNRTPVFDNQSDLRETSIYGDHQERIYYRREGESAMAIPLLVEDEVVGVIFVNRTGHFRFTEVEFETFLLFAGLASAALDRAILEQHNRDLYRASTEVLAAVVDAKDPTTLKHSRHVSYYSRLLAELMELPPEEVERVELAGLLHDVGKLGIPDRVLQKPGRLTDDEFALITSHPDRGARIMQRHPALEDLIPMVRFHHEYFDGRGYPQGLEGKEIPIGARIIGVADAFDTMTSERTYQRRKSAEKAIAELERCAGSQFDPDLVRRFAARLRENPDIARSIDDREDIMPAWRA